MCIGDFPWIEIETGSKRNQEVLHVPNDSPHSERLLNLWRSETKSFIFFSINICSWIMASGKLSLT